MCGIAGYSVSPGSRAARTLTAQVLLTGIAERGGDAVGYAHRGLDAAPSVHKQQSGASALLDALAVPATSTQVLLHVRDYTKGHPSITANNHPVRHGRVVGIHNGIIRNDDELLAHHGIRREEPEMTVDSEVIFALVDAYGPDAKLFERLHGAMAAAWLDEREPDVLYLARGVGRPLWIGRGRDELVFASTRAALDLAERTLRIGLRKSEVDEGRLLRVVDGKVESVVRFKPDRSYRDHAEPPAVRTPLEAATCLERLAAITAAA